MSAVAYIPTYTKSHSVGGDPEADYRIGVEAHAVGCGKEFKAATMSRLTWFTLINGRLIYNGKLEGKLDYNPWSESGRTWHCYRVKYHYNLGPVAAVLAAADVPASVLPRSQNRYINDGPEIQRLITYARAAAEAADAAAASAARRETLERRIAKYQSLMAELTDPTAADYATELARIAGKIKKYSKRLARC